LDNNRSNVILLMLTLALTIYVCACTKMDREVPATEVYSEASMARSIPDWVPEETDPEIRYYFIPEIDVYYDSYVGEYVYWNGTLWVYSSRLPREYAYFDLYDANIVFLSVGVASPWLRHDYYVSHYPVTYFYGPHVHRYGHGWRYYDENRNQFYVSHSNIHHNVHINHRDHPSRGWGNNGSWGRDDRPYGGGNGFRGGNKGGSQPEGWGDRPGQRHMDRLPDHSGEWTPQDPKGKMREPSGKRDYRDPGLKPQVKYPSHQQPPSGGREMRSPNREMGSPSRMPNTPKLNTPPPKPTYSPKMNMPQPQPSPPRQSQPSGNPKGSHGGKHSGAF